MEIFKDLLAFGSFGYAVNLACESDGITVKLVVSSMTVLWWIGNVALSRVRKRLDKIEDSLKISSDKKI